MKNLMFAFALVATFAIHAEESVEDYGGEITVWPKDPGLFLFINSQTKIAGGAFDIHKAQAELKGLGAKGGIFIIDDPVLPVTMVAPEDDHRGNGIDRLCERVHASRLTLPGQLCATGAGGLAVGALRACVGGRESDECNRVCRG